MLQRAGKFLRRAHDTGNLYIGLGSVGFVASGAMAYGEWRDSQKLDAMREMRAQILELKAAQDKQYAEKKAGAKFSSAKPLYSATINRRVHAEIGFDGPLALARVKVGQAVEVLEADIGPEGGYHQCRNEFGEGLYPKAYVTPDDPKLKAAEAARLAIAGTRPHKHG